MLEENNLIDEAAGNMFALFWKTMALPIEETLPCFQK